MESIVLFDPGIRSLNLGDQIIMKSAEYELSSILENRYVVKCATHAPVVTFYQNTRLNPRMCFYYDATYKFICGSNLLWKNLRVPRPVWNINLWNSKPYEKSILLGVGTNSSPKTNRYTQKLYKKILAKEFIHSVRDEGTRKFVESMGFRAINTGCPTMWRFTEEFCSEIPQDKRDNVIFTLTDYNKNIGLDQQLINILTQNYRKVFFWIQGAFDYEYFKQMSNISNIDIIPPSIDAFSQILMDDNVEYVGTRLHAGMFALQHKKRTIILAIDNRVRAIKESYNINCIERDNVSELENLIYSTLNNNIYINQKNIKIFMDQFNEYKIDSY